MTADQRKLAVIAVIKVYYIVVVVVGYTIRLVWTCGLCLLLVPQCQDLLVAARDLLKDDIHTPILVDLHVDRAQLGNLEELSQGTLGKTSKSKVFKGPSHQYIKQRQPKLFHSDVECDLF